MVDQRSYFRRGTHWGRQHGLNGESYNERSGLSFPGTRELTMRVIPDIVTNGSGEFRLVGNSSKKVFSTGFRSLVEFGNSQGEVFSNVAAE